VPSPESVDAVSAVDASEVAEAASRLAAIFEMAAEVSSNLLFLVGIADLDRVRRHFDIAL
jgi:hypothetical protein